jgi:nitrogenase molybdenum-iron protein alpha/beta subunit
MSDEVYGYTILDDTAQLQLRRERLLALEADHYRVELEGEEAEVLGNPEVLARVRRQAGDLSALIQHHTKQLDGAAPTGE